MFVYLLKNSIYLDNVNLDIQYTLADGQLNFIEMIEIRVKHEAYSSKKLERKYRGEQIANNSDPGTINPNKASHMVAYLVNNENPESRFVTQRENRWMMNRKNMATRLIQQHKEDLAKNKETKNKKSGMLIQLFVKVSFHALNNLKVVLFYIYIFSIILINLKIYLILQFRILTVPMLMLTISYQIISLL